VDEHARIALAAVLREILRKKSGNIQLPRLIPLPRMGGMLPLVLKLAGISALGTGVSGISSIVRSIRDIIEAKKKIFPQGRKQQIGNGMYLGARKKTNGLSLYLHCRSIRRARQKTK